LKYPWPKPSLRTSLIERASPVAQCFLSRSFSYCRLDIPTRPPAAARDENEIPWPPSSTCTRCREIRKLQRRRVVVRALAFFLSASVLGEFLLPLALLPFLPSSPSVLQRSSLAYSHYIVYFFSTFLYTDNCFPVLVFVTSFTSRVLLEPTRPPNPKRTTRGTTIRILQLRRSLDVYIANRLSIKAFRR